MMRFDVEPVAKGTSPRWKTQGLEYELGLWPKECVSAFEWDHRSRLGVHEDIGTLSERVPVRYFPGRDFVKVSKPQEGIANLSSFCIQTSTGGQPMMVRWSTEPVEQEESGLRNTREISRLFVRLPDALAALLYLADAGPARIETVAREVLLGDQTLEIIAELRRLELVDVRSAQVSISGEGQEAVRRMRKR